VTASSRWTRRAAKLRDLPGRWTPPVKLRHLPPLRSAGPGRAPAIPPPANSPSPSRDRPAPPRRCDWPAIRAARARGLAAVWSAPRRCSSGRRHQVHRPRQRLGRRQLIAGFEVSIKCGIWVSTEAQGVEPVAVVISATPDTPIDDIRTFCPTFRALLPATFCMLAGPRASPGPTPPSRRRQPTSRRSREPSPVGGIRVLPSAARE
jgi:hypothetical protein